jgi:hypothetical protein
MDREQRRDPSLLDEVLEECRLTRLRNVLEREPKEPVIWVPGELFRFLGRGSKNLVLYRKSSNGDDIAGYSARDVSASLKPG